ncbi:MAG: DUF4329 domain-containing protein [Pseudomonadota bacterium]|nr:DUF4329 domain-containing protein [Pseudomonadota bacterium]
MMRSTLRPMISILAVFAATSLTAGPRDEVALMKEVFEEIQPLSLDRNREYCGYIGLDENGELVASPARKGRKSSCRPRNPRNIEVIIASYHTHGGYEGHDAYEVPSVDDIESDEAEGIDGYVATPGGRLWFIDTEDMTISLVCGPKCLTHAEGYVSEPDADIRDFYTYEELVTWYEE